MSQTDSQTVVVVPVDDEVIAQILLYGNLRAPEEACGIVLPDGQVVELCNVSQEKERSFKMLGVDVVQALEDWVNTDPNSAGVDHIRADEVIFWHTHPSDATDPSREDLESRANLPDSPHLLVAVPSGKAVLF